MIEHFESNKSGEPSKRLTTPPVSATISEPAAISQGDKSISQKAEVVLKYKVIVNGSVTFATHEASTVINLGSYAEAGKKVLLKVVLDNIAQ